MGKYNPYSRVTGVISWVDHFWYQFWVKRYGVAECERVSRESTEYGNAVHCLVEAFLLGKPEPIEFTSNKKTLPVTPRQKFSAGLIIEWCKEAKVKPLTIAGVNEGKPCIELPLQSEKWKLTGHPDLLCTFGEDLTPWVVDWKTSKENRRGYNLQMAAYAVMVEEQYGLKINDGVIIRTPSDPNVSPQFQPHEAHNLKEKYWPVFLECLSAFNYFNERGPWRKEKKDE